MEKFYDHVIHRTNSPLDVAMSNLNGMKIFKASDQIMKISTAIIMTWIGFSLKSIICAGASPRGRDK